MGYNTDRMSLNSVRTHTRGLCCMYPAKDYQKSTKLPTINISGAQKVMWPTEKYWSNVTRVINIPQRNF